MKHLYLVLAVFGAVVPWAFFWAFFSDQGVDLTGFLGAGFANPAAGGFAADLLIASAVFWVAIFRRSGAGGPSPWPFVVLNLAIGLSCALPAYLWVMSRRGGGPATGGA